MYIYIFDDGQVLKSPVLDEKLDFSECLYVDVDVQKDLLEYVSGEWAQVCKTEAKPNDV